MMDTKIIGPGVFLESLEEERRRAARRRPLRLLFRLGQRDGGMDVGAFSDAAGLEELEADGLVVRGNQPERVQLTDQGKKLLKYMHAE